MEAVIFSHCWAFMTDCLQAVAMWTYRTHYLNFGLQYSFLSGACKHDGPHSCSICPSLVFFFALAILGPAFCWIAVLCIKNGVDLCFSDMSLSDKI